MNTNIQKKSLKGEFRPQLDTPRAFPHSATISPDEIKLVEELLEKDAKEHHIFFNDIKLHNHLSHMLLADFSLGATTERLKEIYEQEAKIQRPSLPKHSDFKWTEHLEDENYYPDYLDFMINEVKKLGRIGAVEKYAFDEQFNMLYRWLGGLYHPFIISSYGLEFGIDGMVAEGLALMCVQDNSSKMLSPKETKTSQNMSSETALDIAKATSQDNRFDGLVEFEDKDKYGTLLEKKPELVLEYADKWSLSLDSEELLDKARELMILAVAMYAGPQRPNKEIVFDFYLMHALTSSLFLPLVVQQINPKLGVRLLKGKFAVDLAFFISTNRPALNLEQFKSTTEFKKSWSEIFELAIKHGDEHVPKVIRALKQAERWDHKETLGKGVYRAIAEATVESLTTIESWTTFEAKEQDGKRWWIAEGIGFDEIWSKISDRKH